MAATAAQTTSAKSHIPTMQLMSAPILMILVTLFAGPAVCSQSGARSFELADSGILAAFVDVNTDKRTDILLIDDSLRSFTILNHGDQDDFESKMLAVGQRCFMTEDILSLVPCDFTGDTFVDVAVISQNTSDPSLLNIRIAKGAGPKDPPIDCSRLNETADYTSSVQPLLLDYNGDMIGDLLIADQKKRTLILGAGNGGKATIMDFAAEDGSPIRSLHSNNFVDFNGDNVADIMIETEDHFEYWYAQANGSYGEAGVEAGKRKPSKRMPRPKRIHAYDIIDSGISVFADFDGDSVQEHLMPVNLRVDGKDRAAILMSRATDFQWILLAMNFSPSNETENLVFREQRFPDPSTGPLTFARAVRAGDVNSDGYPDLVTIMSGSSMPPSIVVLKNVAAANGNRTFVFDTRAAVKDPLVAALLDLTESGPLDVVYSRKSDPPSSSSSSSSNAVSLGCIKNTGAMDSYFLKIMVASGRCPDTGCIQDSWTVKKDVVNYGSNLPGPYIWYSLQDVTGFRKKSGTGQMTSASHFALQTPYLVFGLGEYANYIDKITVTIPYLSPGSGDPTTHTGNKRVREEEQIVPDAQIVLVPRLQVEPFRWITKMWISITGNQIKHTGYTLYIIFCILLIIITILHKKEVREDADENKRFKQNWLDHRR